MQTKEYLSLFSNDGEIDVRVKLNGAFGKVSPRRMCATEVAKLISNDGCGFVSEMSIDEWPVLVKKYEIDPVNNSLIIHAKN